MSPEHVAEKEPCLHEIMMVWRSARNFRMPRKVKERILLGKILIIEDDKLIAELERDYLAAECCREKMDLKSVGK